MFLNNFRDDPLARDPFILALDGYGVEPIGTSNVGFLSNQVVAFKSLKAAHNLSGGSIPKGAPIELSQAVARLLDGDDAPINAWFTKNAELVAKLTEPGLPILKSCSDQAFLKILRGTWIDVGDLAKPEVTNSIR